MSEKLGHQINKYQPKLITEIACQMSQGDGYSTDF